MLPSWCRLQSVHRLDVRTPIGMPVNDNWAATVVTSQAPVAVVVFAIGIAVKIVHPVYGLLHYPGERWAGQGRDDGQQGV